jgi:hypothetical protein
VIPVTVHNVSNFDLFYSRSFFLNYATTVRLLFNFWCLFTFTAGIIASTPLISEEYRKQAWDLYHKYYPIEVDPNMSIAEKTPHMYEIHTIHIFLYSDFD